MEVPIRFRQLGRRNVPTMEFHVRVAGQSARLSEFALVDTGSAFTIGARRLLKLNRFDLSTGQRTQRWRVQRRRDHANLVPGKGHTQPDRLGEPDPSSEPAAPVFHRF